MILRKYKKWFKTEDSYSFENFKWFYSHLVTRAFGKYLQYVTMAPFAEYFNHDCSDVFYDFYYNADNPNKPSDYEGEQNDVPLMTEEEL